MSPEIHDLTLPEQVQGRCDGEHNLDILLVVERSHPKVGAYAGRILKGAKPSELPGAAINQIRVDYQS
jgi:hypothetical protein